MLSGMSSSLTWIAVHADRKVIVRDGKVSSLALAAPSPGTAR
jgi:hypothetical protein